MKRDANRRLLVGISFLLVAAALSGCLGFGEEDGTAALCVQGRTSTEFSSLWVTFSRVEIKLQEEGTEDEEDNDSLVEDEQDDDFLEEGPENETTPGEANNTTATGTASTNDTGATETATNDTNATGSGLSTVSAAAVNCMPPPPAPDRGDLGNGTGDDGTTGGNATTGAGNDTTGPGAAGEVGEPANESLNETGNGSGDETGSDMDLFEDSGWTVLSEETHVVDLVSMNGSFAALLATGDLPTGEYGQLRLTIEEAWAESMDGEQVDLEVPSDTLRMNNLFQVEPDATTTVLVSMDVDRSVVQAGASGQWMLRPVVQVDVHTEEGTTADALETDDAARRQGRETGEGPDQGPPPAPFGTPNDTRPGGPGGPP